VIGSESAIGGRCILRPSFWSIAKLRVLLVPVLACARTSATVARCMKGITASGALDRSFFADLERAELAILPAARRHSRRKAHQD
jgi:hypothetical protein